MSWRDGFESDPVAWLLEADSPGAAYLAFRDLLDPSPGDSRLAAARRAAHRDGPIARVLDAMDGEGFWVKPGPGYGPKYRSTVWALILLAELGASVEGDPRVQQACGYALDHALAAGGQFAYNGAPSGTIDCLQGNLCMALMELGCRDPRLDAAFDWMARSVTGEGVAPATERKAAMRYYAYKCGPLFACGANDRQPCAWGAVKVMKAFACLPHANRTPLIQRAIDQGVEFLLAPDPATANYPSGGRKPSGDWWKFGFPLFYVSDILEIADALVRLGYGGDPRLRGALSLVRDKGGPAGRWALEYDYAGKTWANFGNRKQPNKWVTLRALRVIKATT